MGAVAGRADVIVVGGGVNGCSIAYRLAEAGREVLLLEQRGIASGASGRNGGMTGAGSAMFSDADRAVYALTTANLALIKELPDELGIDFDLRLPGTMDVATTEVMYEHLVASTDSQREAGMDVRMLDRKEAQELMPALGDNMLGAEVAPGRGHLWPLALVHGFPARAKRLGAEIRM